MPKVRALTEARRQQEQNALYDEQIRRQIRMLLAVTQMTQQTLAGLLGISRATMNNRMKRPETMTKGEERIIFQLCKKNGIPYNSECIMQ